MRESSKDTRTQRGSITDHCYTAMQALGWVNEAVGTHDKKGKDLSCNSLLHTSLLIFKSMR